MEFAIEPNELLRDLKIYAMNNGIEYDKYLPRNAAWLSRQINSIGNDLVQARLAIESDVKKKNDTFVLKK
jgi:hypothetical protein